MRNGSYLIRSSILILIICVLWLRSLAISLLFHVGRKRHVWGVKGEDNCFSVYLHQRGGSYKHQVSGT